MDYLIDNLLLKDNENDLPNGYVDFDLMHHLKANEFFVYTYLLNAPETFVPSYRAFRILLNLSSDTSITRITDRLKTLKLLSINKMGNVYVWQVHTYKGKIDSKRMDKILDNVLKEQTKDDRLDILEKIKGLEESMNDCLPTEFEGILTEIIGLKAQLKEKTK